MEEPIQTEKKTEEPIQIEPEKKHERIAVALDRTVMVVLGMALMLAIFFVTTPSVSVQVQVTGIGENGVVIGNARIVSPMFENNICLGNYVRIQGYVMHYSVESIIPIIIGGGVNDGKS